MPKPSLARYVLRRSRPLSLAIAFSFLVALLHTATFGALIPFLNVLFGDGARPEGWPFAGSRRLEGAIAWLAADRERALVVLAASIVAITAAKGVARFFQEWYSSLVAHSSTADIAGDLAARVLRLKYPVFLAQGSAAFLSRFTVDLETVRVGLRSISGRAAMEPLKAIGSIGVLVVIDARLALLSVTAFPLVAVTFASIGRRVKKGLVRVLERRQELIATVNETLRGLRVVKSFAAEEEKEREIRAGNERLLREHMRIVKADAALSPLMETFAAAAIGACVVAGGRAVLSGSIEAGAFLAFYVALVSLYEPIRKLADAAVRVKALRAASERIFETLGAPEEGGVGRGERFAGLARDLAFDRVSFSYDGGAVPSLRGVSFTLRRGETLAVVGRSGAGKSTLLNLVPRFFEPTEGAIRIDGRELSEYELTSLRRGIGLVGQEIVLFADTVRRNVAFAADATDERVRAALRTAHASSFVDRLPRGLDTVLGEGGSSLSRGERQRLAIARAVLADPSILLLDEPTSSLDTESEAAVSAALEEFARGRTVIVIAHRLKTVESATRILVLDAGEAVGLGTHAELLETCPLYGALHDSHFGADAPEEAGARAEAAGQPRLA